MFEITYQAAGGMRQSIKCTANRCTIGSDVNNDLVLKSRHIGKKHAVIQIDNNGLRIDDLGSMAGTWVNRERVIQYGPLRAEDEIVIGDVRLTVVEKSSANAFVPVLPSSAVSENAGNADTPQHAISDEALQWRKLIHDKIIEKMDLRRRDIHSMSDDQLRVETEKLLSEIIAAYDAHLPAHIDRQTLRIDVLNEAIGLGPLQQFLEDASVNEIMVNSAKDIFIERQGKLQRTNAFFTSDAAILSVIERIITPLGRRIDESSPMVDARLKDGSRVNAIISPLAIKGPSITIRKFSKKRLQFEDLMQFGSLSPAMVEFLRICVERKKNIVVSGGTGSGKTTLLNVLSNLVPKDERIVTVEDAAELQLNQPNLVALESRPPNLEGRGQVTIRDLVKNALRMRPDRIVVGECRGAEALDMLQAMNTGHDGSLTTAHANSPRDALSRLEVMVMMAGMDLPITAIREQLASAVNIIVQQTRFPCGSRKVTYITEVTGIESGTIQLQNIFLYKQRGLDAQGRVHGYFEACGFVPTFYEELREIGVDVNLAIFHKQEGRP